jgi:hypothetical protein
MTEDRACSTHGRIRKAYNLLSQNLNGRDILQGTVLTVLKNWGEKNVLN